MLGAFLDLCLLFRDLNDIFTRTTRRVIDDSPSTGLSEYQQNEELHTVSYITRKYVTVPSRFLETVIEHNGIKTGLCSSKDIHARYVSSILAVIKIMAHSCSDMDELLFMSTTTYPVATYSSTQLCQVMHKHASRWSLKSIIEKETFQGYHGY